MIKAISQDRSEGLVLTGDYNFKRQESLVDVISEIEFDVYKNNSNKDLLKEECYLQYNGKEYVIYEAPIKNSGTTIHIYAQENVETLTGKNVQLFEFGVTSLKDLITNLLAGTDYTLVKCANVKCRAVKVANKSAWELIKYLANLNSLDVILDSINKTIEIGVRGQSMQGLFAEDLNVISLDMESNTHELYTRIIPEGKDGLTIAEVNNGKEYLDDFTYTKKIKEYRWTDNRYTIPQNLMEDAKAKLKELSTPQCSYTINVNDLYTLNPEKYKHLKFDCGSTFKLIYSSMDLITIVRVISASYSDESDATAQVELNSHIYTLTDYEMESVETSETVDNITDDNSTVSENAIKTSYETLSVKLFNVENINALHATIGSLKATVGEFGKLSADYAEFKKTVIVEADIEDLRAGFAEIETLKASVADIDDLLAGNVTAGSGHVIHLTSKNVVIDDAVIKDLIATNLSVADLKAGVIDTAKFNVTSKDGGLSIVGSTMQFKDSKNAVKMQIGRDAQGNFTFFIMGEGDKGILLDGSGLKENALGTNIIKGDMISEGAVGEKQINYSSLITGLNKDDNTSLIKASKVAIDLTGQSLEVAFNSLKSNVDNMEIGGRNLLLNSKGDFIVEPRNAGLASDNYNYYSFYADMILDETYTISADIEITHGDFDKVTILPYEGGIHQHIPIPENKRIICTFTKISEKINRVLIYAGVSGETRGNGIILRNVKIEKGNKATDWTPAPEDVDKVTQSLQTQITANLNGIEALIKDTTITEGSTSTTLKDAYVSLQATVKGINTTVSSHSSSINTITSDLGKVDGKIKDAVEDVKIGVRNLFTSSKVGRYKGGNISPLVGATYEDYKFTVTSDPSDLVGGTVTNFDKELVVSGYTDLSQIVSYWKFDNDTQKNVTKSVTNGRFEIRIAVPDGAKTLNIGLGQFPYVQGYFIKDIMIQNGNKATDWSPAPEDVDNKIDNKIDSIEIGGRNLLVDSENLLLAGSDYTNSSKREKGKVTVLTSGLFNAYDFLDIKGTEKAYLSKPVKDLSIVDKFLTVSVDIKTTNLTVDGARFKLDVRNSTSRDEAVIYIKPNKNGEWVRYTATLKVTSDDKTRSLIVINNYSSSANLDFTGVIIEYRNCMIEEGNKASAYSKAPEDVEKNLTDLEDTMNGAFKDGLLSESEKKAIKQSLNIIKGDMTEADKIYETLNKNSNLIGTPKTNLYQEKMSYNNAYTSLVSFINTALSSSIVTEEMTKSIDSAFGTYRAALGGFNTRVQEAIDSINSKKVEDIEIGGRNLILDSSEAILTSKNQAAKTLTVCDDILNVINSSIGKPFILSVDVEVDNCTGSVSSGNQRIGAEVSLKHEDNTYSYIGCWIKPAVGDSIEKKRIYGIPVIIRKKVISVNGAGLHNQLTCNNSTISKPKFEIGNKATDWTPAPEDAINNLELGGVNLFIKKNAVVGKYLTNTGAEIASASWFYTDYISVEKVKHLIASGYVNLGDAPATCYYNSSKVFLSGVRHNMLDSSRLMEPPSNASFVRFSCDMRGFNTLKIEQGTKSTAYSQSPEDIDSQITVITNRVTDAESSIEQLDTSITNKVWQTDIDKTIVEVNNRGENLVTNGNGSYKNNTNFTNWSYAGDIRGISGLPSFKKGSPYLCTSDEYIYVDTSKDYRFSYEVCAAEETSLVSYGVINCFDIDKKVISRSHIQPIPNTLTSLAKDLKPGDTVVYLNDLTNWKVDASTPDYQRGFIFWNYKDSTGYMYPPETYSRNSFANRYADSSKVNKTAKTITLSSPWNNGTIPAGTKLSQCDSGATYIYAGIVGSAPTTQFKRYDVPIKGSSFRPGTVSVAVGIMGSAPVYMSNIHFGLDKVNSDELSLVTTEVTNIKKQTASLETSISGISSKVTKLETTTTTINGSIKDHETRLQTTEQKVTATGVITTIQEGINSGANSLNTMQFILDKNGATIKNGALKILDRAGLEVFKGDSNGSLSMIGVYKNVNARNITAFKIADSAITFFDGRSEGEKMGTLFSGYMQTSPDKATSLTIGHYLDASLRLSYGKADSNGAILFYPYVELDIYNIQGRTNEKVGYPITITQPVIIQEKSMVCSPMAFDNWSYNGRIEFYDYRLYGNSQSLGSILNGRVKGSTSDIGDMCFLGRRGSNPKANAYAVLGQMLEGSLYDYNRNVVTSSSGTTVYGNFYVEGGTKNRIVTTDDFGVVKLNAYETSGCYFGDIGNGLIGEDGTCIIAMDIIYLETVNTKCDYFVFLQKYGNGDLWVEDREETYFIVKGTPGLKFVWEVKARQRGYETDRLDQKLEDDGPATTYGCDLTDKSQDEMENLLKSMEVKELCKL